jgi:hypothetical protein
VKPGGGALLLGGATIVVVAVAIAGFLALGSPGDERARQLDRRRIEDLRSIANGVENYYDRVKGERLPDSLAMPGMSSYLDGETRDPVTGTPYGYRVLGSNSFELCATFQMAESGGNPGAMDYLWDHPAGPACFEFEIEAGRRQYPPRPLKPSGAPALRPTRPSGAR